VTADLYERRLRVVPREHGVDVRRPFERASRAGHQRDGPALAVAVHARGRKRVADQVAVGDPRQVDAAGRGEAVPLPQARVHLEQLVPAVARVAHELDLRDAVEVESPQESEPVLDDLVHPERLAGARAAHVAPRLAQLVPGEEPERLAVPVEVAAERVHLLGAARDQLLHHRLVRSRGLVRALELDGGLAAEELALVAAPEADVGRRLDDEREADFLAGGTRFLGRGRVQRARDRHAGRLGRLELVALALDLLQHVPAREREAVALAEHVGMAGDGVQVLVVGGEDRKDVVGFLRNRAKRLDEALLVVERVRSDAGLRVPRAQAERVRAVVDREHAQALPPERADRREAVDPGDLDDHGRAPPRHPRESSYAPEAVAAGASVPRAGRSRAAGAGADRRP
jgi:hypothetical protein